jgi:hypothetical protein
MSPGPQWPTSDPGQAKQFGMCSEQHVSTAIFLPRGSETDRGMVQLR